jgi:hypothetical protein
MMTICAFASVAILLLDLHKNRNWGARLVVKIDSNDE